MQELGQEELIGQLERVEMQAMRGFYASASKESIRECGLGVAATAGSLAVLAARTDVLAFNRVIGLGQARSANREDLDQLVNLYRARQVPRFFLQVSPIAAATGLPELLRRFDFRHYNNWVKLYREGASPPPVDSDLEVRRIGSDESAAFGSIAASCFNWPPNASAWVAELVGRPDWSHYMAYAGSKPVATGAFYSNGDGYAWIDFAATLPRYRGRGAQSALLARRIRDAVDLGCRRFVVETAEQTAQQPSASHRNMLAFGFRQAYVRPNYIRVLHR